MWRESKIGAALIHHSNCRTTSTLQNKSTGTPKLSFFHTQEAKHEAKNKRWVYFMIFQQKKNPKQTTLKPFGSVENGNFTADCS